MMLTLLLVACGAEERGVLGIRRVHPVYEVEQPVRARVQSADETGVFEPESGEESLPFVVDWVQPQPQGAHRPLQERQVAQVREADHREPPSLHQRKPMR